MTIIAPARHTSLTFRDAERAWMACAARAREMDALYQYTVHHFPTDPELVAGVHADYLDAVRDAEYAYRDVRALDPDPRGWL